MSIEQRRNKVQQLRREIADLEGKRSSAMKAESDALSAASRAINGIPRNASESTIRSRTSQAESKQKAAERERTKIVDLQKKIAGKHKDLVAAEKALQTEEEQDRKKQDRAAKKADDDRRRADAERQRAADRLRADHERQVSSLRGEVTSVRQDLDHVRSALARELPQVATVLLLFADPTGTLRLDQEMRAIHQAVRLSEQRDGVKLEARWAARPKDITQAILDTKPSVVHFSGHGTEASGLAFEGDDGEVRVIEPEVLVGLVRAIGQSVRVIIYNACWSERAAEGMAERVEVAIGMDAPVTDAGAKAFAAGFYRAIGSGESVAAAFEVGRFELRNTPRPRSEEAVPVMISRADVDPESVFLVAPSDPESDSEE